MNVEEIEKYLKNEMNEDERVFFESCVKTDTVLKKELEEHAAIYASFDKIREEEMKANFMRIDRDDDLEHSEGKSVALETELTKRRSVKLPTYFKWAASIAVIAAASWLLFFLNNHTPSELFTEYYTTYPNTVSPVSRSGKESIADYWQFYETGQYENAYSAFKIVVDADPENEEIRFYLGICALETGRNNEAANNFSAVAKNAEATFFEQAQWYLGLTYLKMDDGDTARKVFQTIASGTGSYRARASEVYLLIR